MQVNPALPRPFILRRLHSLLGVWLVIYLCEHLWVNAQAALFFFDNGSSFVRLVSTINALPGLKVIEIVLLGLPFLIHGVWGVKYALTSKSNIWQNRGERPALGQYRRNRAYTWQRITSWLLIPLILGHVIHMRIIEYPKSEKGKYFVHVTEDKELASKMGFKVQDEVAEVDSIGTAFFLILRETFKNPLWAVLYSLFVVAATYHAANGIFTALISWGIILTRKGQNLAKLLTNVLFALLTFLGLAAIWGTFLMVWL